MKTLRKGSRGDDVVTLQKKLSLMPDGIFGPLTLEAVEEFQKNHGLLVDGIVGPKTWEVLNGYVVDTEVVKGDFPITGAPTKKRKIDQIILHCSATPEGENFTIKQIELCHIARGFNGVGYNWYVDINGKIWKGRSEDIAGAHCTGHNTRSIGICYAGGCPPRSTPNWDRKGKDTRTLAQKEALLAIIKEEMRKYPNATLHGHNEFANKACPGFNVKEAYKDL